MRAAWLSPVALLAASGVVIWDGVRIMLQHRGTPGGVEVGGYEALLGLLLALLVSAWWIKQVRAPAAVGRPDPSSTAETADNADARERPVWLGLGLLATFIALLEVIGFTIATLLFMVCFLRLFGTYRWRSIVSGSVLLSALATGGLMLLDSPMPRGWWYGLLF